MSFDTLGLAEPLLRAVAEYGYTTPTPIQLQAIPAVLSGGDVMGGAQTGTGKTAGFVLPMLHRLLDHHQQRTLDLSHVQIFVLDEADRMLDMGFVHDIKKVLAVLPAQKQSLLFSATFSDEIKALADRLLNKPVLIEVARRNQTNDAIAQKVHPVGREMKKDLLIHLIKANDWDQVLVFTRMKHGANRLVEHLLKADISAMAIHGNKSQT
ncbi:MAG: DEAD/DEAH box helicase, partial [Pseudomonadota bacterium]